MSCWREGCPFALERPQEWTDEFIDWATQDRGKKGLANTVQFLGSGQIQGRLVGGNLNTMSAIWGSQYMPDIKPGDTAGRRQSQRHRYGGAVAGNAQAQWRV